VRELPETLDRWSATARRATVAGVVEVGVAPGGVEEGGELAAERRIISPVGEVVAMATTMGDEVVDAVLDLDACVPPETTVSAVERYRMIETYGPIVHQRGTRLPS
jgi:hypothetical protein